VPFEDGPLPPPVRLANAAPQEIDRSQRNRAAFEACLPLAQEQALLFQFLLKCGRASGPPKSMVRIPAKAKMG